MVLGLQSIHFCVPSRIGSISGLALAMEDLDDLLFTGRRSTATGKEYDRTTYNMYAFNPKAAFQKLYMYSFNLVKPEYVFPFHSKLHVLIYL